MGGVDNLYMQQYIHLMYLNHIYDILCNGLFKGEKTRKNMTKCYILRDNQDARRENNSIWTIHQRAATMFHVQVLAIAYIHVHVFIRTNVLRLFQDS